MSRLAHRPVPVNILTFNTHVGEAIYSGGLKWLLGSHPDTHLVLLQEVQSVRAKFAARRLLSRADWLSVGGPLHTRAGTYVFARRRRFELVSKTNERVTKGLTGKNAGMWPERRLTSLRLADGRTGRTVDVTSVHHWAMGQGLDGAPDWLRRAHIAQSEAFAEHHADAPADTLQIAGGDVNERLARRSIRFENHSVVSVFREVAGMRPAFQVAEGGDTNRVDLDDIFVRPRSWLRVLEREMITVPFRGVDHEAVRVRLEVEPK